MTSTKPLAVVTGASNGIGLELAKQFARNGFDLLISQHEQSAQSAVQELEQMGANVQIAQADLATSEGVDALYQAIQSTGRPVEAIAINAGVGIDGYFKDTDLAAEMNIIQLNVVGTVHLAKHIVRDMAARGQGRILFTSSIAGTMPTPFEAIYGASKAFILSFAESLHNELQDSGVTVTALLPGPTDTNFFHRADMDDTKAGAGPKSDPAQVAEQGFDALMAGEHRIVAGNLKTKVQDALGKLMPETLKAGMHRAQAEPGSASS